MGGYSVRCRWRCFEGMRVVLIAIWGDSCSLDSAKLDSLPRAGSSNIIRVLVHNPPLLSGISSGLVGVVGVLAAPRVHDAQRRVSAPARPGDALRQQPGFSWRACGRAGESYEARYASRWKQRPPSPFRALEIEAMSALEWVLPIDCVATTSMYRGGSDSV